MSQIKSMTQVFICVIAGNTIGAAIFLTLFERDTQFSYEFLWQFIGIAAICALGNLIFWSRKELTKKQIIFRYVLHYLYNNSIVIGGAFVCKWIEPGQTINIAFLFLLVALIYVCITVIMFENDIKTAEDVNKKLRKYNESEE